MDMSSIGKNIRKKRLSKSWKQEILASKVEVTAAYIGMIERAEKIPKLETLVRIINVLGATADEILEGVINRGYEVRMSEYMEKIGRLPKEEQNRIFDILDVMLEHRGRNQL
ncbi:MAG: helix-turn-helix transcriptional regulator [Lachnospiraceae bacterium]|nr:helix-turn-helix transcriptional regulator [Lachnospiraceae bacterium]MDE6183829.1 helix-turn-helix transcriptional regulator [Lachnospiraceae bacterium]MDE7286364.1 helix-turn-helix transcriptional regulator [Lachnospiraceae bacterium]